MGRTGVDYADYNITVYREPCPYKCVYCWAWRIPLNAKRIRSGRYDPVVEAERIARKCRNGERVVVSFTSDPYLFREAWINRTTHVILALRRWGRPTVMVLTKNPLLALKDRDVMIADIAGAEHYVESWLGTTVTSADTYHPFSTVWEPNAPRTALRLKALREFQREGGYVWLSLEPLIPVSHPDTFPETIIVNALKILDPERIRLVVLGRLNYVPQLRKHLPFSLGSEEKILEHYREHVPEAVDILKEHGIPYHIKKELKKCLGGDLG